MNHLLVEKETSSLDKITGISFDNQPFILKTEETVSLGPGKKTEHHRKPQSLGGKRIKRNISIVPHIEHKAWHRLFDNLPAELIPRALAKALEMQAAWNTLFGNKPIEEVIETINKVWIDPDFQLTLTVDVERTKGITITKR